MIAEIDLCSFGVKPGYTPLHSIDLSGKHVVRRVRFGGWRAKKLEIDSRFHMCRLPKRSPKRKDKMEISVKREYLYLYELILYIHLHETASERRMYVEMHTIRLRYYDEC